MKIVLPGGSGQVGILLARRFAADGHEVVTLSREPARVTQVPGRVVGWDAANVGAWAAELDGADAVVNLAGRSVNCRYDAENRRQILESRVQSTRAVGAAIARAARPPRVWLQAGTATVYAHRFDAANDEATGAIGGDEPGVPDTWRFSVGVAKAWEAACHEAATPHTRKVILRSAMTMSPDPGGVFDVMLGLVRRGLGGTAGDGRQYLSWLHGDDFIDAVYWLIGRGDLAGPVNLAAPNPLPNAEFMCGLRRAWGTRVGLPATRWMVGVGARLLRTEAELVLKSRRVVPTRLTESGFAFRFPTWPEAAADLVARWRERRSGAGTPAAARG